MLSYFKILLNALSCSVKDFCTRFCNSLFYYFMYSTWLNNFHKKCLFFLFLMYEKRLKAKSFNAYLISNYLLNIFFIQIIVIYKEIYISVEKDVMKKHYFRNKFYKYAQVMLSHVDQSAIKIKLRWLSHFINSAALKMGFLEMFHGRTC